MEATHHEILKVILLFKSVKIACGKKNSALRVWEGRTGRAGLSDICYWDVSIKTLCRMCSKPKCAYRLGRASHPGKRTGRRALGQQRIYVVELDMQGVVFSSVETSTPVGIHCYGTSRNGTTCFECFHCAEWYLRIQFGQSTDRDYRQWRLYLAFNR